MVERYGADTARLYILFIGPADQDADWSDSGVEGVHRFLARLWRLAAETAESRRRRSSAARATPRGAGRSRAGAQGALGDREGHDDLGGRFAFNTAIAAVMELVNECLRALRDRRSRRGAALRAGDGRVVAVPVCARTSAAEPSSC